MLVAQKNPTSGQRAASKALRTAKTASALAKALAKRYARRWQFVDFLGPKGHESAGIVDIVAIRKSGLLPAVAGLKKLDLFDIVLMQVKGGSAPRPTPEDVGRLRRVQRHYKANHVVLYTWKNGQESSFKTLSSDNKWVDTTAWEIFG